MASSLAPRLDAPDPAAGIDARTQDEAERVAGRRLIDAGGVGERAQALIVPEPQDLEPLGHEGAVRLSERHHVAHRGERHEVEQAEQVGLGPIAIEAVAAQRARGGDEKQKHDTGRGEMPLAREIVLAVRIEHGECRRQRFVGLVMVDDDDFRAGSIGGGDGGLGGGAAIDGEDEAGALLDKIGKRLRRRAVAFGEPIGNIGRGHLSMRAQEALDQRHRSRAVDVVVAEYGDRLACPDGGGEAHRPLSPCPASAPGRAAAS